MTRICSAAAERLVVGAGLLDWLCLVREVVRRQSGVVLAAALLRLSGARAGSVQPRVAGLPTGCVDRPPKRHRRLVASTRPPSRARRVTAALCRLLQDEIDVIGLNVRADNAAAIACYRNVGFEIRHAYDEWRVLRRPDG